MLSKSVNYAVLNVIIAVSVLVSLYLLVDNQVIDYMEAALVGLCAALFVWCFYLFRNLKRVQALNIELKHRNATKDKFFSVIAHDLKSPFSSLLGFAEILTLHAENHNIEEVVKCSNQVHSSAKRLFQLVENLLVWSRAQIGTLPYRPMPVDVAVHTSNVVSLMRPNAEAKDVVVSSQIGADIVAFADVNHFDAILRNLLSNAIKYSKVGGVVSIGAAVENGQVNVWVKDTGLGMHPEQVNALFNSNHNLSESGTLQEKGTGLGLLICKEFVGINKGVIMAESQLGRGSVFKFTLPLYLN